MVKDESVYSDEELDEEGGEQQELYEHFRIDVDKGQSMLRVDKFITSKIQNVSRNRVQSAADAGNILVNGKAVKSSYKVKPFDSISIVMAYPPREIEIIPENIPINIVYEDDDLVVVNKDAGMVVHPGHGNYTGTLVNALMYHLRDVPLFRSGDVRPGLVHRIDKNTSGILVIAKTEFAMYHLARQFFERTTKRRYVALVWGDMEGDEGTVTGNIGRSPRDRMKMHVFADGADGKHAVTHWKVLERLGYVTLIECRLETGRTHQIRVHMEHLKHPIFNDDRYGGDSIVKGTTFTKYKQFIENCFAICPRHALHAQSLGFIHPTTGKELFFESDIPTDMLQVIDRWKTYTAARPSEEGSDR
jgi:23S rRNA pseudouridine1911/1915/1917 synthase